MNILVTGALGFIGAHLCERLLNEGHRVYGLDNLKNLNTYDGEGLYKVQRLARIRVRYANFFLYDVDLAEDNLDFRLAFGGDYDLIFHLAAETGVQASNDNPELYFRNNVVATQNVLMACKKKPVERLIYASSSSVYGNGYLHRTTPMNEMSDKPNPISYYGGTKAAAEDLVNASCRHFGLRAIGCRFFTVYGPMGRKDMAPWIFANKIMKGETIQLRDRNHPLYRDFTYVDDIVDGLVSLMTYEFVRHAIFNIGHGDRIDVGDFISLLEDELGKKAIVEHVPLPKGDAICTYADMSWFDGQVNPNRLKTSHGEGASKFVTWFKDYNKDMYI